MLWQRQPIGQQLAALGDKALVEQSDIRDAIDTEIAEVVPELAPGAEQGGVDVIAHRDRTNSPTRVTAVLVNISDGYLARFVDRIAQGCGIDAGDRRRIAVGDINRRCDEMRLQRLRDHDSQLGQHASAAR